MKIQIVDFSRLGFVAIFLLMIGLGGCGKSKEENHSGGIRSSLESAEGGQSLSESQIDAYFTRQSNERDVGIHNLTDGSRRARRVIILLRRFEHNQEVASFLVELDFSNFTGQILQRHGDTASIRKSMFVPIQFEKFTARNASNIVVGTRKVRIQNNELTTPQNRSDARMHALSVDRRVRDQESDNLSSRENGSRNIYGVTQVSYTSVDNINLIYRGSSTHTGDQGLDVSIWASLETAN